MTLLPPAPKFERRIHHVVPASWQRRFASSGMDGPYYRNIILEKNFNAQGPGEKMAEDYVNIIFDEYFRPSDALEDKLSTIETKAIKGLDNIILSSCMTGEARVDIAALLATQVCRYPECYSSRMDIGRYLAIALKDYKSCANATQINARLKSTGLLPGANISEDEFKKLSEASDESLLSEVDIILGTHGYEAYFNNELVVAASLHVAEHLLGLEWRLLKSEHPCFILSDRPVPTQINYGFSVSLSACFALEISKPNAPIKDETITSTNASEENIAAINREMRSRAREWICGPGSWVHYL
jgi:hypothetical protein